MYIAQTVSAYLSAHDVGFDVVPHRHTKTSVASAMRSHVPTDHVAKAVLLCDNDEFVLAVLPASHRIDGDALSVELGDRRVAVAEEEDVGTVFRDCERGALPAIGEAYGLDTIVDLNLLNAEDVYFEAGDHEHLIHVTGNEFRRLMAGARRGLFAYLS
jgi:Ala-tRNA(Pro) deacylase